MGDEQDLSAEIDLAWAGFRSRLADRLAELGIGEVVSVNVEIGDEVELDGAAPYVQFCGGDDGVIRAEAVSNGYLDERYALTEVAEARLLDLGWEVPSGGVLNFHLDVEPREADRIASISVATLREAYAVPHPVFLEAEGLEIDPDHSDRQSPGEWSIDDEPLAVLPESRDELQALVDAALAPMLGGEVRHDSDGDVAISSGQSTLFVRVHDERPEVVIFAVLVRAVEATARVATELELLNRRQSFARFSLQGQDVHLSYELCAIPFAARQLRAVVADLLCRIDEIATDLQQRVGGRRWLDETPMEVDAHPGLVALLELLHTGSVDTRVVAGLLDHDRLELIQQLVRIRTGRQGCDGHDQEVVLDHLRRALRYVVDGDLPERGKRRRSPPRRDHQLTLLDDDEVGDDSLDLGLAN